MEVLPSKNSQFSYLNDWGPFNFLISPIGTEVDVPESQLGPLQERGRERVF